MNRNITIKGSSSDWYDEATFTLKPEHTQPLPTNLVDFADELVENHLKKNTFPSYSHFSTKSHTEGKYINLFFYGSLGFLITMALIYFLR